MVDDEDFEKLNEIKWNLLSVNGTNQYAVTYKNNRPLLMHRIMLDFPKGKEIDHINGNGLDNRRKNLRVCTHSENLKNKRMRKDNTSGHIGVWWSYEKGKWRSGIRVNGEFKHLGLFKNKLKAAMVYKLAAEKYFGEFKHI